MLISSYETPLLNDIDRWGIFCMRLRWTCCATGRGDRQQMLAMDEGGFQGHDRERQETEDPPSQCS